LKIFDSNRGKLRVKLFSKVKSDIEDYIKGEVNTILQNAGLKPHSIFLDYKNLKNGVKIDDLITDPKPIIFISNYNLLDEASLPPEYITNGRKLFFNSSIWCFLLILNGDMDNSISTLAKKINENRKLYDLNVAKEYYDFILRLYKNSYLQVGGHSSFVTPFKFHSETRMKNMADRFLNKDSEEVYLPDFKWRILLVDDYAEVGLKIGTENDGQTKKEILEKVLGIPEKEEEKEKYWIQIETCKSVSDFVKKYSQEEKIYDIILLDYLLDRKSYKDEIGGREYSIDIFKWIKGRIKFKETGKEIEVITNDSEIITYGESLKGPLGKFWFLPISAFPYAFMEDIRQMGYTQYDDDWVIARGADPVNTPQLFRYSLFKFMEAQLNEVYKHYDTGVIFFDFIKNNFDKKNGGSSLLNKKVEELYPNFLKLKTKYDKLLQDEGNSSLLAKSIISKQPKEKFELLFAHLNYLLLSIAYSLPTATLKKQLSDEIDIIKSKVEDDELSKDIPDDIKNSFNDFKTNLDVIEKKIIKIKI